MKKKEERNAYNLESFQRTEMQKKIIIQKLREKGCRVTRQRLMLLDIILENECSCCKEIYYSAVSKGAKIGLATVYRMVNTLEEIGAIRKQNMYQVVCSDVREMINMYTAEFNDGTIIELSADAWFQIISAGLRECGYTKDQELHNVRVRSYDDFSCLAE